MIPANCRLQHRLTSPATACIAAIWLVSSAFATDPMRTTLIVNEQSIDSLTIANHYASLRGIPDRCIALRELGHKVIIDTDTLPRGQLNLMGAMLGSANYDWPLAANRLLPGSIADNLTSTSGVLHQANNQTSMVELLRGGAAGTSGTVTEPYALT